MANKTGVNPFAAASNTRQDDQDTKKRKLKRDAAAGTEQVDEARVKLTLALSDSDKIKLKTVAAQRHMTVAAMVHKWVDRLDEWFDWIETLD